VTACSCTPQATGYWSATTVQSTPTNAWTVNFSAGSTFAGGKSYYYRHVRAVRGGL
jgi:hypothetical protein